MQEERVWTGNAHSVHSTSSLIESTAEEGGSATTPHWLILSSGDQVPGMSGSPVFNGCGLVGIAAKLRYQHGKITHPASRSIVASRLST